MKKEEEENTKIAGSYEWKTNLFLSSCHLSRFAGLFAVKDVQLVVQYKYITPLHGVSIIVYIYSIHTTCTTVAIML